MADGFQLTQEFGENKPSAKKEAYKPYMEASRQFRAEIKSMVTMQDLSIGDQLRARLPEMMKILTPLREAVENAGGMLDFTQHDTFVSERGYWVRLHVDTMPNDPILQPR